MFALPLLGLGAIAAYMLLPRLGDDAADVGEQTEQVSAGKPDTKAFCDHLRVVSEHDEGTETMLRRGAPWAEVRQMFRDQTPAVSAAYAGAVRSAPEHLRASVETLRRFTDDTAGVAANAQSFAELREYLVTTARTEAVAAGRASQEVDGYTRSTCGFSLNNEGG